MALKLGKKSKAKCKNCKSASGMKLDEKLLSDLVWKFFVQGSYIRTYYGGFNRIEYNEYHHPFSRAFEGVLNKDAKLISQKLGIGFFDYAPQMWKVGQITQLEQLAKVKKRKAVIESVFAGYPTRILTKKDAFFRLRKNLATFEKEQFDAAPRGVSRARMNLDGYPTLYGSDNIEICIHECRATLNDDLYVAKLRPTKNLKCLDLSGEGPAWEDVFESLSIAMSFLFRAGEHSYSHLTKIARAARTKGFDGIVFPSYYNQLKKTNEIQNIALFGKPIKTGLLKVECINRILLSEANYEFHFGPTL